MLKSKTEDSSMTVGRKYIVSYLDNTPKIIFNHFFFPVFWQARHLCLDISVCLLFPVLFVTINGILALEKDMKTLYTSVY